MKSKGHYKVMGVHAGKPCHVRTHPLTRRFRVWGVGDILPKKDRIPWGRKIRGWGLSPKPGLKGSPHHLLGAWMSSLARDTHKDRVQASDGLQFGMLLPPNTQASQQSRKQRSLGAPWNPQTNLAMFNKNSRQQARLQKNTGTVHLSPTPST